MLVEEVYQCMIFAEKKYELLFMDLPQDQDHIHIEQLEDIESIGLPLSSFHDDNEQIILKQKEQEEEQEEEEEAEILSSVAMEIAQSTARLQQQSIIWNSSLPRKKVSNYITKRRAVSFSLLPQKKSMEPSESYSSTRNSSRARRRSIKYPPPVLTNSIQKAASYHGLRQIPCSPPVPIPPSQWKRRSSTPNFSPRRTGSTFINNTSNMMTLDYSQEEARFWDENWHLKLSFESRESFALRQQEQNHPQRIHTQAITTTSSIKEKKQQQDQEFQAEKQKVTLNQRDIHDQVFDMDDI
jgi:hypothetical protein